MSVRKAVYAGSFDPITNGHINVIERIAPLYDELVVIVAADSRKTYAFTSEERMSMTKAAVAHLPNVTIDVCVGRYVVKHADLIGAQVIIRGLRNFKDLEDEHALAEENRRICAHIETVWVPCLPDLMHLSSSMVKGHVGADPDWEEQVARSVPAPVVIKLKEKFILDKARKHWTSLISALGNPKGVEDIFKDLITRYGEPHRTYHNLEHIITMLDELEQFGDMLTHLEEAWAIWHHDAVCDPKAKDNEEQSDLISKNHARKLGLPDLFGELAGTFILATKHSALPLDDRAKIVVDLDMAILGKPEKEFDSYEARIRREYDCISQPDFYANRSRILQSFLDRPSIYSTELFRSKYESIARKNMERSIGQLQK